MSGQLRSAFVLVLELLRDNQDALALGGPPEVMLPAAASMPRMPRPVLRAALAWGMALLAELLGRAGARAEREANHFAVEALDLARGEADPNFQCLPSHLLSVLPMGHRKAKKRVLKAQDQRNRQVKEVESAACLGHGTRSCSRVFPRMHALPGCTGLPSNHPAEHQGSPCQPCCCLSRSLYGLSCSVLRPQGQHRDVHGAAQVWGEQLDQPPPDSGGVNNAEHVDGRPEVQRCSRQGAAGGVWCRGGQRRRRERGCEAPGTGQ
jgi:hypothetical protein